MSDLTGKVKDFRTGVFEGPVIRPRIAEPCDAVNFSYGAIRHEVRTKSVQAQLRTWQEISALTLRLNTPIYHHPADCGSTYALHARIAEAYQVRYG